jgi:protein-S-isoprenylcysteine O-methyltransferase Ste14
MHRLGFSVNSWKGEKGEYWVLLQAALMLGFVLLPVYRLAGLPNVGRWSWAIATPLLLTAVVFVLKGLLDLGSNLTPLPYPIEEGQLVQTGVYAIVRHPLYSGIILGALGVAIGLLSLSHLAGAIALFIFFDFKARKEETWLSEKFADYAGYRDRVKKLLPWIY